MIKWYFIVFLLSSVLVASSQKLYIEPYVGYGFGIQKDHYSAITTYYYFHNNYEDTWYTNKLYKLSFGKGFRYGVNIGSEISKNFALELGFEYFKGSPQKIEEYENIHYVDYGKIYITYNHNFQGKYLMFKPALVISKRFVSFRPFARVGAYLGKCSLNHSMDMDFVNTIQVYIPYEDVETRFEFENRFTAGYFISLGCEHNTFDRIKFSLEVLYGNISYVPTKGEYTKYLYQGDDYLDELKTNERYFEYVDSYTSDENDKPNEPTKVLKQKYSFNHLVINFGIRFAILNGKKKDDLGSEE